MSAGGSFSHTREKATLSPQHSPAGGRGSPLLTLRGIDKRFGATHALKQIDLELVPGEALALVGENGAGKSTLVKILTGVHQPDAGEIVLGGEPQRFARAREAQLSGIVAVHQETVMFDELSAAENIFIGRQPMHGPRAFQVIDWATMHREAQRSLDQVGAGFSATTKVKSLSLAQRHLVESRARCRRTRAS